MKIDRLLGIVITLLQNKKVTAPYLAERFEVSRRTIQRDIEDICKAGIPIITIQGVNGGISIAEGYQVEKDLFSQKELEAIFTGLLSLDTITENKKYQRIIEKFSKANKEKIASNHICIDLSSHYKDTLAPKIQCIEKSISSGTAVWFHYCNSKGEQDVFLDPYRIIFKWSNWYVFGAVHGTSIFKLYKLNRLTGLQSTTELSNLILLPEEEMGLDSFFTDKIHAVIHFDRSVKYRLIEEYGVDCFKEQIDGILLFEFLFTNEAYLLEWVLSFGDKAKLIEPTELRNKLTGILERMIKNYLET